VIKMSEKDANALLRASNPKRRVKVALEEFKRLLGKCDALTRSQIIDELVEMYGGKEA